MGSPEPLWTDAELLSSSASLAELRYLRRAPGFIHKSFGKTLDAIK